jgi:hypothetical protein
MRITVHLDAFDHAAPATYAILWLDKSARRWSREGHAGIDFPSWGTLLFDHGRTSVMTQDGMRSLCMLDGLDLSEPEGPFEGESGIVSCVQDQIGSCVDSGLDSQLDSQLDSRLDSRVDSPTGPRIDGHLDSPAHGQWHVQWVDPNDPVAESSVFADDEI